MNANWILNDDGSIYHLKLRQEHLARTIITVGDPARVEAISKYFDRIEFKISNREFVTHTGFIGSQRISIIATGIGTDNIDIVMNEIDALFNIDFETQQTKDKITALKFIRIGTSGAVQNDIPVDSLLITDYAIGVDGLMKFYNHNIHNAIKTEFQALTNIETSVARTSQQLFLQFNSSDFIVGNTLTCAGFYAPQGRITRIPSAIDNFLSKINQLKLSIGPITNFEMETSGIYGLGEALGHQCISLNAIMANRIDNIFSKQPEKTMERLIKICLEKIITLD